MPGITALTTLNKGDTRLLEENVVGESQRICVVHDLVQERLILVSTPCLNLAQNGRYAYPSRPAT
jgi:hypothetical protein